MDILLGMLATTAFFLCLGVAYEVGHKHARKTTATKLTEREELEVEKRMKGMQNVMEYDYDVAIGKKVNR